MKYCVMCGSAVGSRQSDCPRCGAEAFSASPPTDATPVSRRERWTDGGPSEWQGLASMLSDTDELVADMDLDLAPVDDDSRISSYRGPAVVLFIAVAVIVLVAMVIGYMLA